MVINLRSANRNSLSIDQKEFLIKALPWSYTISEWIIDQAALRRLAIKNTLSPHLVLADILVESQWGSSPISKPLMDKKYANNLAALEATPSWQGKVQEYEGKKYKSYKDWVHFASDYAEHIVYNKKFHPILNEPKLESQLNLFSKTKPNASIWLAKASTLLDFYSLTEL